MTRAQSGGGVRALAALMVGAGLLAGCAGRPLSLPTRPPVSADPSRTVAPPSPSAAATRAPGQAAVDGLRARLSDDGFSYRVSVKGDVLATVSDLTLTGSISVAGKSSSSAMAYTFESGGRSNVATRIVGGSRWVRTDKGAWKKTSLTTARTIDPFAGALTPGALTDAGPKTVAGKPLRAIRIQGGRLLDLTTIPAYNLTEEHVTSALLTVYVDRDGKPVSGHWIERGQGRVSGQLQEVDVDVDLTFSNVGGAITISAP